MRYCGKCGTPLDEQTGTCPKCGTAETGQTRPISFSVWNMAFVTDWVAIAISLLLAAWVWSLQSELPSWLFSEEKMVLKFLAFVLVIDVPLHVWNMMQRKKVCVRLDQTGISGIWIRKQFLMVQTQPFELPYSEIQDTRVRGAGSGRLNIKVQGKWVDLPVDQGRQVKELIDQRRQ